MGNNYNIEKFRKLLRTAIGDRTQKDFAAVAGLSHTNLNRMLNVDTNGIPSETSLCKIAQASQGRVTIHQLYAACGYDVKNIKTNEKTDADADMPVLSEDSPDGAKKCAASALALMKALKKMSGFANKYGSIEGILETAAITAERPNVHTSVGKSFEYNGTGRHGAEHFVHTKYFWYEAGCDAVIIFTVFYSVTEKGGYIFSDCAFDLSSLMEIGNPDAVNYVFKISMLGDVVYTDYPIICDIKKHVPGEAERKLLRAIFGDSWEDAVGIKDVGKD